MTRNKNLTGGLRNIKVNKSVSKPNDKPNDTPVEIPVDKPVETVVEESTEKSTEKVTDKAVDKEVETPVNKPVDKVVSSGEEELVFNPVINIPAKVKDRPTQVSYTVTSDIQLTSKLDKMCKKKGYRSRNEMVNVILKLVLNSPDK